MQPESSVLDEILFDVEAARSRGRRPVLLFDVDDTVLSTARRHLRILREFADKIAPALAEDADSLRAMTPERVLYSIADTAKAAGVDDEAVLGELRRFWFERFFANEYLLEDREVPGAAAFCQEALVRGARIVYLTDRDEGMREGTLAGLAQNGLPTPDGEVVQLILKPRFETPEREFKVAALSAVSRLGDVAAGFENEPAHINLFRKTFPAGRMVLLETRHSGKPVEADPGIERVADFRAALPAAA